MPGADGAGGYKDGGIPYAIWSGFYIGANGGYAWGNGGSLAEDVQCSPRICPAGLSTAKSDFTQSGGLGGGQIGYNWQRGGIVYGFEADIQAADVKGSATVVPLLHTTASASAALDWFGTVRGRLGVPVLDRGLLYVTGGFAYGEVEDKLTASSSFANAFTGSQSKVAIGYTVGGGFEYAFGPEWSLKGEYQYIDLGPMGFSGRVLRGNARHVRLFRSYRIP